VSFHTQKRNKGPAGGQVESSRVTETTYRHHQNTESELGPKNPGRGCAKGVSKQNCRAEGSRCKGGGGTKGKKRAVGDWQGTKKDVVGGESRVEPQSRTLVRKEKEYPRLTSGGQLRGIKLSKGRRGILIHSFSVRPQVQEESETKKDRFWTAVL